MRKYRRRSVSRASAERHALVTRAVAHARDVRDIRALRAVRERAPPDPIRARAAASRRIADAPSPRDDAADRVEPVASPRRARRAARGGGRRFRDAHRPRRCTADSRRSRRSARAPALRTSRLARNVTLRNVEPRGVAARDVERAALASVATTRARGRSLAIASAIAPEPVPRSATRDGAPGAMRSSASSTRSSVSGRGISTAGDTARSSDQNSRWPVRYATGSPRSRACDKRSNVARCAASGSCSGHAYSLARDTPSACASSSSASSRASAPPRRCVAAASSSRTFTALAAVAPPPTEYRPRPCAAARASSRRASMRRIHRAASR